MHGISAAGNAEPQRILVVLPTWVGDFVMATPTLRAIRKRFPEARITFLMEPNLRELAAGGDWMDECVEWGNGETPKRPNAEKTGDEGNIKTSKSQNVKTGDRPGTWWELRRALRARKYDLAILLPNSFWAAMIARLSGAKRRVGYARDGRSLMLTDRIPVPNRRRFKDRRSRIEDRKGPQAGACGSDSSVASWLRASVPSVQVGAKLPVRLGRYVPMPLVEYYGDLAEAVGGESPGDRLELFSTPDCETSVQRRLLSLGLAEHHPLVVISPGAKFGASKCWMPERFAALADRLIETHDVAALVTCGPGEEPIARAIGSAMKKRGFVLDEPRLSLGELKSLIRRCDLWIGNDAGPRHIAKAFNVPAVTIFGPTHPDWTSTSYADERIVRIDVDCGPCQQRICPLGHHQCMTGVTVDAVFQVASKLLETRTRHHVATR